MKFLDKLGLALFSIITLIIAIVLCLIGFGWMEPAIFSILIGKVLISQTYTYVMIGICIAIILLGIRCIFFSGIDEEKNEKDVGILLQNEDGKLLITVETLKNMVEGVINDFNEITDSESTVMITKENEIVIDVSINVVHDTIIKNISSKLQMQIKKDIKDTTGLEIESVNVRVKNVEKDYENKKQEIKKENKTINKIETKVEKNTENKNDSKKQEASSAKKASNNSKKSEAKSTK